MSIETDIKQKSFKNPYQKLAINLVYTSNWLLYRQMDLFREYDLTLQQYNVLRILRGQQGQPIRVSDISERMLDKSSNTSRLVDKLLVKGLAERTACSNDRRAVDVIITTKGKKILAEMDPKVEKLELDLGNITPEEANTICDLLDKMRKSS
ncbi:MarR family winged helix-turn-helix transcriptional regulator [Dyadobacter jejuensis]|nr:MarR family transcriptional regulator [Dyadobacter jejuensis]